MPGFIENIKRQKEAEEQDELMAAQNAEKERVAKQVRIREEDLQKESEEKLRERKRQTAKTYFEQTGIEQIAQKLISIKAAKDFRKNSGFYREGVWSIERCGYVAVLDIKGRSDRDEDSSYIEIETSSDGDVIFWGGDIPVRKKFFSNRSPNETVPFKIEVKRDSWQRDRGILEDELGKTYYNPIKKYKSPAWDAYSAQRGDGPCLASNSLICVPDGFIKVSNLKFGDYVWTVTKSGDKIQAVVVKKDRRLVSRDHKMAHIILEDGRKLVVSPRHPTIDNKELGSLKKGQILDGSQIVSAQIKPYGEKYTYDILPAGDTGAYWANGILIGSTLSPQFMKIQQQKINKQVPWYARLFA